MKKTVFALLLVLSFLNNADAALHRRGWDMVYDDSTDLTWVSFAALGAGSAFDDGYPLDGRMTYASAVSWVSQLTIKNSDTGAMVGGWRLPNVEDLNTPGCDSGYSSPPYQSADCGYVGTSEGASELAYLIHGSLGNPTQVVPSNSGPFTFPTDSFAWLAPLYNPPKGIENKTKVLTVEGWLLRNPDQPWPPQFAWGYDMGGGFQGPAQTSSYGLAWAVQTGDVAVVPEPLSAVLFVSGGLLLARKRY